MTTARSFRLITVAGIVALGACDGGVVETSGDPVASVTVTPESETAEVGGSIQLRAVLRDAEGEEVSGRRVFWSSSDADVATVSDEGRVSARAPGTAQVAASSEGQSDVSTITVRPPGAATVTVRPASATLTAISRTVDFGATVEDSRGNELSGKSVTWKSSSPGVAEISSSGVATATGDGVTTITAEVDGVAGTATLTVERTVASVTVTPSSVTLSTGETTQLSATASDAEGFVISGASISWSSSNSSVAAVSTSGNVEARSPGEATIAASADGKSGTSTITVAAPSEAAVASVDVDPSSASINVGGQVQLTATLTDAEGNVLGGRDIAWESGNPEVASVDASGLVTGESSGTATITATSEGRSDEATVSVAAGEPARLQRAGGNNQEGPVGETLANPLAVRVTDGSGSPIEGVLVEWDIRLGDGTIDPDADLTDAEGRASTHWTLGTKPGEQKVTATVEGLQPVEFQATARTGPVSSVSVSPGSATLSSFEATQQFTATAEDAFGNVISGVNFSWRSSESSVAEVPSGDSRTVEAVARRNGETTIVAETSGIDGTATLTVDQQVAEVVVTPAEITLEAGTTQELTAEARDANGNLVEGVSFTWASSDENVATVDESGVVTGLHTGSATITATAEGKSGGVNAQVNPGAPAQLLVDESTNNQVGTVGEPLPNLLVVTVVDANANAVEGITVTWTPDADKAEASPSSTQTEPSGQTQTEWTLGELAGEQHLTAAVEGAPGVEPVVFTATAQAAAPDEMDGTPDDIQSGSVPLRISLEIQVFDRFDNPVPGQEVEWTGDGHFESDPVPTDQQGKTRMVWCIDEPIVDQVAIATAGEKSFEFRAIAFPGGTDEVCGDDDGDG